MSFEDRCGNGWPNLPILPETVHTFLAANRSRFPEPLGGSQWVRVDTGCATAFQWVTLKERAGRCTSKLAVGLAELSIPQTMTGVRIGNHCLDAVPTGLHRKAIFPGESGLLGNGLLARFGVVTIDAKSGRLILGRSLAN